MKTFNVIDSHTMGEPTRIVVGGVPNIPGKTMPSKKEYLEKNMDYIRTSLMFEPRGHKDMFGAIITPPTIDEADFGIVFMDCGGYLNMCGHGSIGATTVAIETEMVPIREPITEVTMEAPAGIIKGKGIVKDNKVQSVSIVNVPSFLYKRDVEIEVPEIGKVVLDISFGGSFFALVDAKQLNISVDIKNIEKLTKVGLKIRDIVNKSVKIRHPYLKYIKTVDLVEIYDETTNPNADKKNVVIFGKGQVDRSPCGTGTSAKMATLYEKGQLKKGEEFIYESIVGTTFNGKIIGTTKVGEYSAVIPEITGKAYITGFNQYIIVPEDPVKYGFIVK